MIELKKLEKLEQTTALRILAFLHKKKKTYLSELMRGINSTDADTVNRGIEKLVELGLMVDEGFEEKGRGKRRWLLITEKGRIVAEKVKAVMESLE